MTNLDSILKSKDITLPTKFCLVKAMVFPVVIYGCKSWTIKKAECWRIVAFELRGWRRLLRVPWTASRSNQCILKEISPEYSLEGLMLKLKLQYLATWCKELTHWKDPDGGKDWRQEEKGTTEDEMVGWHHQFNGHESEQTLRAGDGQGSLACCSPWGCKDGHNWMTELNWEICQVNMGCEGTENHWGFQIDYVICIPSRKYSIPLPSGGWSCLETPTRKSHQNTLIQQEDFQV